MPDALSLRYRGDKSFSSGGSTLSASRSAPNAVPVCAFIRGVLPVIRAKRSVFGYARYSRPETPVTVLAGNLGQCGHVRHNRAGCVWTYGMRTIKLG
ncbi:hypothetical protein X777_04778 [Ooceraea biroi]|uniref:Uncharacterized protein n=1 Tax=Ooceraea biroi TaxID=2015173 RepID=A0A026WH13_OOCBI|nr:hypothetical protein X777_04778 [Ooceraea biroi]